MSTSLSSLVTNLSDELYNDKCTDCKSCLDYMSAKDNQLIFKCLKRNKNHNEDFNKDLIIRFASKYKFCNGDINKIYFVAKKRSEFIHMNTWVAGKDLMKNHCLIKKIFTAD